MGLLLLLFTPPPHSDCWAQGWVRRWAGPASSRPVPPVSALLGTHCSMCRALSLMKQLLLPRVPPFSKLRSVVGGDAAGSGVGGKRGARTQSASASNSHWASGRDHGLRETLCPEVTQCTLPGQECPLLPPSTRGSGLCLNTPFDGKLTIILNKDKSCCSYSWAAFIVMSTS